jgi:hypothetical protein
MKMDIAHFYLMTPLKCPEYVKSNWETYRRKSY